MKNMDNYELVTKDKKTILQNQIKRIRDEFFIIEENSGLEKAIEKAKTLKNKEIINEVVKCLFESVILKKDFELKTAFDLFKIMENSKQKNKMTLKLLNILSERNRFDDVEEILNNSYITSPDTLALAMNYTSIKYFKAGDINKSIALLIQSVKNISLINHNHELKKSISIEINQTINTLNSIEPEKRTKILIKKLWYVYYLLLFINKKLLHTTIKIPSAIEGSGDNTVSLGCWDISKIECSISGKKENGHNTFIFNFRSETQRLNDYEYIAIAYQGELITKILLENCDFDVIFLYRDYENMIKLPNDIEIFIIPEEKEGNEDGLLFSFNKYKK